MKSKAIKLFIILSFPFILRAQIGLLPSVGVQIPLKEMTEKEYLGSDFGVNLTMNFEISETMDFGVAVGYHRFSFGVENYSNVVFPITLEVEKKFGENPFKPLFGLGFGVYNKSHSQAIRTESSQVKVSSINSSMGGTTTLGFCYNFSRNFGLHVAAKYHYIYQEKSPYAYFSTNIGIAINFKKERSRFVRF